MPNPRWILTDADAAAFAEALDALPGTSVRTLSGSLGYRGLIVECQQGGDTRTIHVQRGIVRIASGVASAFAADTGRALERWLLNTGRPHVSADLLAISERELH